MMMMMMMMTRILYCDKKLTRLLFDFRVINTTDDACEQQLSNVAICLQQ